MTDRPPTEFQSSPAPKSRCYGIYRTPRRVYRAGGFNPHRLRRAGATLADWKETRARQRVSILTGSEEPVLRIRRCSKPDRLSSVGFNPHRLRRAGATWSLGWVGQGGLTCFNPHRLRRAGATYYRSTLRSLLKKFQSSPAPKSRCYTSATAWTRTTTAFQSSPAPKSRCYTAAPPRPPGPRRGFNPHRLRRAGATRCNNLRVHLP